jgi:hypothetical protein
MQTGHNNLVQFDVMLCLSMRCMVKFVVKTYLSDVEVSTSGVLFQVFGKLGNGRRAMWSVLC